MVVTVSAEGFAWSRSWPLNIGAENTFKLLRREEVAIVGKVVEAGSGKPVTRFNVRLDFSAKGGTPGLGLIHTAGKDFAPQDGGFELKGLESGRYAVVITAEDYAPARVDPVECKPVDSPDWPLVVELGQGKTIRGSVVDAGSGEGIPDAEVFLITSSRGVGSGLPVEALDDASHYSFSVEKTRADKDGRFEFSRVSSDYSLLLAARHKDYSPALRSRVDAEAPNALKLVPGGSVAGTAAGFRGIDLQKAKVDIEGPFHYPRVAVDPDGSFRFDGLAPGDYRVRLNQEGYGKRNVHVCVESGKTVNVDFANIPGKRVFGRVTCGGKPVARAHVGMNWSLSGDWVVGGETDRDGRFDYVGIPPGEYSLRADQGDFRDPNHVSTDADFVVADEDVEVELRFYPNVIRGRLIDAVTGDSVAGAYLTAYRLADGEPASDRKIMICPEYGTVRHHGAPSQTLGLRLCRAIGARSSGEFGNSTRTDETGWFEIKNVEPGLHLLTTYSPETSVRQVCGRLLVGPKQTVVERKLILDERGRLNLKVVDALSAKPIKGAKLTLCNPAGFALCSMHRVKVKDEDSQTSSGVSDGQYRYERMETDEQGELDVGGVRPGDCGLWVVAHGYAARWISPVAVLAFGFDPFVIRLQPTGSVLLKPDENLLNDIVAPYVAYRITNSKGAVVFPGGEVEYGEAVETGAAGFWKDNAKGYVLDVIPPGKYTMEWEIHSGYEGDPVPRPIVPAICCGKAEFDVVTGQQSVVALTR